MSERANTTLAMLEDGFKAAMETAKTRRELFDARVNLGEVHLLMEPALMSRGIAEIIGGMRGRNLRDKLVQAARTLAVLSSSGMQNPLTVEYAAALERDQRAAAATQQRAGE